MFVRQVGHWSFFALMLTTRRWQMAFKRDSAAQYWWMDAWRIRFCLIHQND